ncbi:N-alpha-acetyltransferase 38, NatC auxiliary subunit [Neosynchiropus ocellatus]
MGQSPPLSSKNQVLDRALSQDQSAISSFQVRHKLEGLLNKNMRIRMTDGRTLVGLFLCTDRDCNVILGSAQEFLKSTDTFSQGEPRVLGLAMIPGHHVVSIEVEADSLEDMQGFGVNH